MIYKKISPQEMGVIKRKDILGILGNRRTTPHGIGGNDKWEGI